MAFFARLLAAALALPGPWYLPGHEPETADQRAQRVETIVTAAIAESHQVEGWPGTDDELAAAMLSVTWFESRRWALEVHDGARRGDHGSSVCLAQIWSHDRSLAGTSPEATRRCFRKAAQILGMHAARCGIRRVDEMQMARLLGAYGTGRTCHTMPWARKRARLWAKLMAATDTDTNPPDKHALPMRKSLVEADDELRRWPARAKTLTSLTAP